MIKKLERTLSGTYFSGNNTVSFSSNPFISQNSSVSLWFTSNDSKFAATVVSISGNNIVTDFKNLQYDTQGVTVKTPCFGGGLTGVQANFSLTTSTTPNTILQATVYNAASNTANVKIEVSSDNIGWITANTISLTGGITSGYYNNTLPWAYARLNVLDVSAGSILTVTKSN